MIDPVHEEVDLLLHNESCVEYRNQGLVPFLVLLYVVITIIGQPQQQLTQGHANQDPRLLRDKYLRTGEKMRGTYND